MAAFGLLANRCVADPAIVAVALGLVTFGTVVLASATRQASASNGAAASIVGAGAVAAVGLVVVLEIVTQNIFVLC